MVGQRSNTPIWRCKISDQQDRKWHYHPERGRLVAEAHARPFTPMRAPMLASRIATLSGQEGEAADRAHMAALCRSLGRAEPDPASRWYALDAGKWRLRWERHTEFSSWTFFAAPQGQNLALETALDAAPLDWLASIPGAVLVATNVLVIGRDGPETAALIARHDSVGAIVLNDAARVFTDLRPGPDGLTTYLLVLGSQDEQLAGRLTLTLLEIETYRLMALLGFPLAGEATGELVRVEQEAGELAAQMSRASDPESDHALLNRLTELAGETEALGARISFRFGASLAYHEIVNDRIETLQEQRIAGLQTLGEFMERRLGPAMRTCETVSRRQHAAIERIARTEQMLNTRVEVATEATNAALLASMDRRARDQLQLQRAVEGFSVFAITYYAVSLAAYGFKAAEKHVAGLDATLATAVLAPVILIITWLLLRYFRGRPVED